MIAPIESDPRYLLGRLAALEIVLEETLAALARRAPNREALLAEIGDNARREVAEYTRRVPDDPILATTAADSVTRLITHLSLATAGSIQPRSRL